MDKENLEKTSSLTLQVLPEDFMDKMNQRLFQCFGLCSVEKKTLSKELFYRLYSETLFDIKKRWITQTMYLYKM